MLTAQYPRKLTSTLREFQSQTNIGLVSLLLAGMMMIAACGRSNKSDEIIVERDAADVQTVGVQSMPSSIQNDDIKWVADAMYSYSITRNADTLLSKVVNHEQEYLDNSIELVIKRSDGTVFFEKKFTKKNFENLLPKLFVDNGVLLGMNFNAASDNELNFVVSVGSPDENNEEYYLVLLTVDNQGRTKAETFQMPKEESLEE